LNSGLKEQIPELGFFKRSVPGLLLTDTDSEYSMCHAMAEAEPRANRKRRPHRNREIARRESQFLRTLRNGMRGFSARGLAVHDWNSSDRRNAVADTFPPPVPLGDVLKKEQEEIIEVRKHRLTSFKSGHARPPAPAPAASTPTDAPKALKGPDLEKDDPGWVHVIRNAHEANFVGLAFSGGGIRSATFNLGVLQALADLKLLCRVDYLSTVSGGGYIGGWLAAWAKRLGSFAEVQERISTHRIHLKDNKEQTPVRFLRVFSNYLTPKLGFFSGDTWAMIAIYLRNLLLNQTIVFALVATLLLAPRVVNRWTVAALGSTGIGYVLMGVEVVLLLVAFIVIQVNMGYLNARKMKRAPGFTEQQWTLLLVAAPLFGAAVVAALWLNAIGKWGKANQPLPYKEAILWLSAHPSFPFAQTVSRLMSHELFPYENAVLFGAIVYSAIWGFAKLSERIWGKWIAGWVKGLAAEFANPNRPGRYEQDTKAKKPKQKHAAAKAEGTATKPLPHPHSQYEWPIHALATVCAGALAGWLFALLAGLTLFQDKTAALPLTVGVPLVAGVFLLAEVLHIGLMGIVFRDWKREWWGRLGGWLLLFAITWLTLFWLALFFPDFIRHDALVSAAWKAVAAKYLTPAWILSTIGTVLAGNSAASGKPGTSNWMDTAIKVGPYIFMAGLLCWISWTIDLFLAGNGPLYKVLLVCAGVALLMGWRVDINQFSMHMFYRNRLIGCFLGASNEERSPNRFTGLDPGDDLPLKDLRWDTPVPYDGPYPVLNATLNLVKGKDLAWQERKAESFVMTPHFCGYDVWLEEQDSPMLTRDRSLTGEKEKPQNASPKAASDAAATAIAPNETRHNSSKTWREEAKEIVYKAFHKLERYGYRPTGDYAFPTPVFHGPNLGLAMGISGAAASPNMGFYSSTPVAFLMTVFNVRLGQWLGNPRHRTTSRRATPHLGLWCLINELLGGTNDEASYVYLSDGGHFDNMGLYELVKRRCGLIVVCDAEADNSYTFSGLGNAIRKCRIDMGIDIDLDTSEIAPKEAGGPSSQHCVVGQIHYENADKTAPMGTIVYFKASLTGDEPADVKNYKKQHASFPHESTIDQWFSESQFESYRQLGYHEMLASIEGVPTTPPKPLQEELHTILTDFGFELDNLRHGTGKHRKAISGARVSVPAPTTPPNRSSTIAQP
jgi:hypothetical protein